MLDWVFAFVFCAFVLVHVARARRSVLFGHCCRRSIGMCAKVLRLFAEFAVAGWNSIWPRNGTEARALAAQMHMNKKRAKSRKQRESLPLHRRERRERHQHTIETGGRSKSGCDGGRNGTKLIENVFAWISCWPDTNRSETKTSERKTSNKNTACNK